MERLSSLRFEGVRGDTLYDSRDGSIKTAPEGIDFLELSSCWLAPYSFVMIVSRYACHVA